MHPSPPRPRWLYRTAVFLLVSMHLAGLAGLNWSVTRPLFTALTPFNLLSTLAIVLCFHREHTASFWIFCTAAFLVGFLVEVVGVQTGLVFGTYRYGPVLGWKLWDTPLLIGCNWLTLAYCTGTMASRHISIGWLRPVAAATLMLGMDVLIEPVAMHLDFWQWEGNVVPLQNYVAWFAVALGLQWLFRRWVGMPGNAVAAWAYGVQFVFFLGCNLWMRLS